MSSAEKTPSDPRGELSQLSRLRELHVRAARGAAGLSVLLAGTLAVVVYFVGGLVPTSSVVKGLLALTPFVWVVAKEWLDHSFGDRCEPKAIERQALRFSAIVVAVSCAGVLLLALVRLWGREVPWEIWASLTFTVALPIMVWRHFHWVDELILGTFLMYQAVTILTGQHYEIGGRLEMPVVGLVAMLAGAKRYHDWRRLGMMLEQTGRKK